jgi:hypothetical protein
MLDLIQELEVRIQFSPAVSRANFQFLAGTAFRNHLCRVGTAHSALLEQRCSAEQPHSREQLDRGTGNRAQRPVHSYPLNSTMSKIAARLAFGLHAALMLGDPRRGVAFGGELADRGRMPFWDADLDAE